MANYRKIYAKHYGIVISPEYAVHHIDGNRENNDIENLLLLPLKLHSKYHFYKNIIDCWDKDTSLGKLYPSTYTLEAIKKFSEACEECFHYCKIKNLLDMGASPESVGLIGTEEPEWQF